MLHQTTESDTLTPTETEAVLQMWAVRHGSPNAGGAAPRLQDLAEAIGATPSEVGAILAEVRSNPRMAKRARRKFGTLRLLAYAGFGVVLWGVALGGAYFLGMEHGRIRPVFVGRPVSAFGSNVGSNLPKAVSAEFRGYTIRGSLSGSTTVGTVEEEMFFALSKVVSEQAPPVNVSVPFGPNDLPILNNALQKEVVGTGMENVFRYEQITVKSGGQTAKVLVPVSLTSSPLANDAIAREQQRRMRVAANKAAQLYAETLDGATKAPVAKR